MRTITWFHLQLFTKSQYLENGSIIIVFQSYICLDYWEYQTMYLEIVSILVLLFYLQILPRLHALHLLFLDSFTLKMHLCSAYSTTVLVLFLKWTIRHIFILYIFLLIFCRWRIKEFKIWIIYLLKVTRRLNFFIITKQLIFKIRHPTDKIISDEIW